MTPVFSMKNSPKNDLDEIIESLDEMRARLRDVDRKVDHLIKNLRQVNGRHDPYHSNMSDLTD